MAKHNSNQIYQAIINRLGAVRRTWRLLIFTEYFLKWISILACAMTFVLLCFQLPLPLFLRGSIVVFFIGIVLYFTFRILVRPILRKLTYASVASHLEKAYPNIENRILSTVQLKPILENNPLGYAQEFVEKLISQTQNDIEKIESKKIFHNEYTKIRKYSGVAVVAVGILLLTNFLLPSALKGITNTLDSIPKTPMEGFTAQIDEVRPGSIHVKVGDDVNIRAKVSGHLDAPVYVYYRLAETDQTDNENIDISNKNEKHIPHLQDRETWQPMLMDREPTDIPYSTTIEKIDRSLQYYVSTKDIASDVFDITVRHEPIVKTFQFELNYPAYTQLPSQLLDANTGDAEVLYGTEIVFTGESNKPLSEAHLIFDESDHVQLNIEAETNIKGSFVAKEAGKYHIQIQDTDGLTNSDSLAYTINVFKDASPQVEIVEPGRDLVLDNDMLVKLQVEATDDYGLQTLQLVHRIQKEIANDKIITLKQLPATTTPPQSSLFISYSWDIDPLGLFPGETLAYYVQALDTDDVSGPNIGKSRTFTLRFPTLDELYEDIASEQETEQLSLDELFDEQTEATGIVDQLLEKVRKFKEFSLTDQKLMQQVVESQKEIERKANELINEMEQTATDMEKNQLFEPETIQKYQELQELMKEALSEEHQELLQKLAEAMAKQQLTEQENAMTEANFNQEQFQQRLERLKSLYEQLIMQQKLEAAAKQAKELAEQQKQLVDSIVPSNSEKTEDTSESANNQQPSNPEQTQAKQKNTLDKNALNDAAQKEDRIKQKSDKLSEKLDTLSNEMSDMAKSQQNAAEQIQKVADELKELNRYTEDRQLSENLQKTSENLRNAQQQQAQDTGRQAEKTMQDLAQGLDNALEFMQGSGAEQALAAMQEAIKSGLYLSHLHEKVINKTGDLLISSTQEYIPSEIKRLQQLAAKELSTSEGLSQLAEKLWELGKQQMQIDPKIVWRLNAASDALKRSARALEDREASLAIPIQRQGLADINQVIFELLNAMAQMNQQMGAGGMQDMLQQLQQLAQSQEQLNEMAQSLSQQMREEGRTPGIQQRLESLAAQQQLIREATERLAELAENAAEILGSLKDVASEMEEVETKLETGTLDEKVIEQQERIVTRMLNSLKSLQKRDVGRQRKAEVAKRPNTPVQEVPPLHPELLEVIRKLEATPNAKELENIPFQYREQLRQYFKALSQKTK